MHKKDEMVGVKREEPNSQTAENKEKNKEKKNKEDIWVRDGVGDSGIGVYLIPLRTKQDFFQNNNKKRSKAALLSYLKKGGKWESFLTQKKKMTQKKSNKKSKQDFFLGYIHDQSAREGTQWVVICYHGRRIKDNQLKMQCS